MVDLNQFFIALVVVMNCYDEDVIQRRLLDWASAHHAMGYVIFYPVPPVTAELTAIMCQVDVPV